jgi:hypothetical protein
MSVNPPGASMIFLTGAGVGEEGISCVCRVG